jgi:hypothetical protein
MYRPFFLAEETINRICLLRVHVEDFTEALVTRRVDGNCFPIAWCTYPQRVHNIPEHAGA